METKKTARLEAFEEALQTGKIGISKPTASVLVELSKIYEAVERIADFLGDSDEIAERYSELTEPLTNQIKADWANMVFGNICFKDCKEL